ncbi:MAG: protein kinase [Pyrinomonadaceae bacterium]
MNSEIWERVQSIFDEAIDLPFDKRDAYIKQASDGDDQIVAEVRSLINAYESAPNLLEDPVKELGFAAINGELGNSVVGETIKHYRIVRKLGGGGMGDVYLAENQKVNLLVALKFLNADLLNDRTARNHLRREAELVASLEHPNICQVYDFEDTETQSFIVMQYVKGESLLTLLREGRFDRDSVRRAEIQLVSAIAAAHYADMIHRDLKPGNIMITENGEVKVLDFGLATVVHDGRQPSSPRDYITNATQKGLILGTVAYMSPEQLKGEPLDFRTDIFSLGTLLFELETRRNPFHRDSDAETIAAILDGSESLRTEDRAKLSSGIRKIVLKCLEVKKDDRYSNAEELLIELEMLQRAQMPEWFSTALKTAAAALLMLSLIAGIFVYTLWRGDRGVAVLPFANETGDARNDYLADGLADTLATKLSQVDGYRVVPYSKVAGISQTAANASAVAKGVKAELVLTGRIFRESGELIVETKLIDAADSSTLRTTRRTLDSMDIQDVENALLEDMFSGSELPAFGVTAAAGLQNEGTRNTAAFNEYLVARHAWRKRDRENLPKAIDAFQRAIDLDPTFARAYAGLADSYVMLNSVAYGSMPAKEAYSKARAAAKQALEIDPLNAEAHTSLGVVLMKQDSNWKESERELRQAISLDPEAPSARFWFSGLLAQTGRVAESVSEAEKAKVLDPFSPLVDYNLARTYYYGRQFERSIEILNEQSASETRDAKIDYLIGLNKLQQGKFDEALAIFQTISAKNRMLGVAAEGYTLARMERRDEALKLIAELERDSQTNYVPPQEFAIIHIGLNNKDKAFEFLNKALEERSNSISSLRVEPLYDTLRDDVRFADLLRRLSLDQF